MNCKRCFQRVASPRRGRLRGVARGERSLRGEATGHDPLERRGGSTSTGHGGARLRRDPTNNGHSGQRRAGLPGKPQQLPALTASTEWCTCEEAFVCALVYLQDARAQETLLHTHQAFIGAWSTVAQRGRGPRGPLHHLCVAVRKSKGLQQVS